MSVRALVAGKTGFLILSLALGFYALSVSRLDRAPRQSVVEEMQVAIPRSLQVVMALGDRYLAANLAEFRALVASSEYMEKDNYRVQGMVQSDAAWFNPAHGDNYYIAAATLPWNGEVDAAQYVLKKAMEGRPKDWQPVFYYAFNLYHFKREPVAAAEWLMKGLDRAVSPNDRMAMQNVAANWYEKGYDPKVASGVIAAMAKQSREGALRKYLEARAERLQMLDQLRSAVELYRKRFGATPADLDDLVRKGILQVQPQDPFGFGFELNGEGIPVLRKSAKGK